MNNEVKPGYGIALKLWWAMVWRTFPLIIVLGLLAGIVMGIVFGVLGAVMDFEKEQVLETARFAGAFLGIFLGLFITAWVIRRLMIKGFGRYCLAIVENENA